MKTFKIVTRVIVQETVERDFWVDAETADEAKDILEASGFSEYFDKSGRIEEGDERFDGDTETTDVEIESIEEADPL